jgi:hypothetical protein
MTERPKNSDAEEVLTTSLHEYAEMYKFLRNGGTVSKTGSPKDGDFCVKAEYDVGTHGLYTIDLVGENLDSVVRAAMKDAAPQAVPAGFVLVPVEPTEAMWSGLARDIVFWLYMNSGPHYGSKMYEHLRNLGTEIPDWLLKEIPDTDSTPPKGTVAVVIYKAMCAAAPKGAA